MNTVKRGPKCLQHSTPFHQAQLVLIAVEKVKLPLRGGDVPRVTSSGLKGIPTFLHPLTYFAGTGSAKDDIERQNSPTVCDTQNLGFDLLLSFFSAVHCCTYV